MIREDNEFYGKNLSTYMYNFSDLQFQLLNFNQKMLHLVQNVNLIFFILTN